MQTTPNPIPRTWASIVKLGGGHRQLLDEFTLEVGREFPLACFHPGPRIEPKKKFRFT